MSQPRSVAEGGRVAVLFAAAVLVLGPVRAHGQPSTTPPVAPTPAPQDAPATAGPGQPRDIVIVTPGTRSRTTDIVLISLAGAAAISGAVGVSYNLDAQSAANKVSATGPTGLPWTAADQQQVQRAHDSSVKAGVFYGLGGALLVGSVVGLILTVPTPEKTVIHPRIVRVVPTVAPTTGGMVAGGVWKF